MGRRGRAPCGGHPRAARRALRRGAARGGVPPRRASRCPGCGRPPRRRRRGERDRHDPGARSGSSPRGASRLQLDWGAIYGECTEFAREDAALTPLLSPYEPSKAAAEGVHPDVQLVLPAETTSGLLAKHAERPRPAADPHGVASSSLPRRLADGKQARISGEGAQTRTGMSGTARVRPCPRSARRGAYSTSARVAGLQ